MTLNRFWRKIYFFYNNVFQCETRKPFSSQILKTFEKSTNTIISNNVRDLVI